MIFADTSFFFANIVAADSHHAEAVRLHASIEPHTVTTSIHVVGETWSLLRRRTGHFISAAFLRRIRASPRFDIRHIEPELECQALDWLISHDEREYSFVDATSFALMRSLGITDALAFDGDFAAAGFVELRP